MLKGQNCLTFLKDLAYKHQYKMIYHDINQGFNLKYFPPF